MWAREQGRLSVRKYGEVVEFVPSAGCRLKGGGDGCAFLATSPVPTRIAHGVLRHVATKKQRQWTRQETETRTWGRTGPLGNSVTLSIAAGHKTEVSRGVRTRKRETDTVLKSHALAIENDVHRGHLGGGSLQALSRLTRRRLLGWGEVESVAIIADCEGWGLSTIAVVLGVGW